MSIVVVFEVVGGSFAVLDEGLREILGINQRRHRECEHVFSLLHGVLVIEALNVFYDEEHVV